MPSSPASVRSALLELNSKILGEDDKDIAELLGAVTPSRRNRSRKDSEPNKPAFNIGVNTNLAEQIRAAL
jgi:hypothetical protein